VLSDRARAWYQSMNKETILSDQSRKSEAQASLKAQKAEDGRRATAEYEAAAAATRAKTARLRELRLAHEAEQAKLAPAKPARAAGKSAKSSAKTKTQARSLSNFLKDQDESGRRS
jgi:hypothetical protein